MEGVQTVALTRPASDRTSAFVRLVAAELPGAYRLAGFLLRDATEAEDATQEALARAWQGWPKLRDKDRPGPWFDRIVVNVCHDRLRQRRGRVVLELEEVEDRAQGGDPFRAALARDEVGRLVRRLPPDQQVVVALRFWRDLSLEEIAERVGVPLGTVKSRLHYALRSLREELDRQGTEVLR